MVEAHMERVVDGAACVRRVVGGALKKTCSDNRNVRPSMFDTLRDDPAVPPFKH